MFKLTLKVNQLTQDNEKLPSAFALKKLAEHTVSHPMDTAKLYQALKDKASNSAPCVAWKAFKSMKYLVEHGSKEFTVMLHRDIAFVNSRGLRFSGPNDQLTGDSKNERVRITAKELLATLQHAVNNQHSRTSTNTARPKMQGYGNSGNSTNSNNNRPTHQNTTSVKNHGYNNTYSNPSATPKSKYEGFGNPNFDNTVKAEKKPTFLDKSIKKVNKWAVNKQRKAMEKQGFTVNQFSQPEGYDATVARTLGQGGQQASWEGKRRTKHSVGGGWDDDDGEVTLNSTNSQRASSHSAAHHHTAPTPAAVHNTNTTSSNFGPKPVAHNPRKKLSAPKSDGVYERKLVDEVTVASGMRSVVPKKDLQAFITKCKSLDLQCVAEILDEKLLDQSVVSVQKTLQIIGELLQLGWAEVVDDYFVEHLENLHECAEDASNGVRKKANTVLHMLGAADDDVKEEASTGLVTVSHNNTKPVEENLFAAFENQDAVPAPVDNTSAADLGFDFTSDATATSAPVEDDDGPAFAFMEDTSSNSNNNNNNNNSNDAVMSMFGDMEVSSVPATTTASADTDLSDLGFFGDATTSSAAPVQKKSVDPLSLFDDAPTGNVDFFATGNNTVPTTSSNNNNNNNAFTGGNDPFFSVSTAPVTATSSNNNATLDPFAGLSTDSNSTANTADNSLGGGKLNSSTNSVASKKAVDDAFSFITLG